MCYLARLLCTLLDATRHGARDSVRQQGAVHGRCRRIQCMFRAPWSNPCVSVTPSHPHHSSAPTRVGCDDIAVPQHCGQALHKDFVFFFVSPQASILGARIANQAGHDVCWTWPHVTNANSGNTCAHPSQRLLVVYFRELLRLNASTWSSSSQECTFAVWLSCLLDNCTDTGLEKVKVT